MSAIPDYHALKIASVIIGPTIILTFITAVLYDIIKKMIKKCVSKRKGSDLDNNATSIDIRIMIYIDLFIILLHMIASGFNASFSKNDEDCELFTRICLSIFHIQRCLMYAIFVRRIQVIFNDTVFALSSFHTYLLYGIIAIYTSIPFVIYISWGSVIDITYNPQTSTCFLNWTVPIYYFSMAVTDIFIAIYCLYLFVYPLWKLIKSQQEKKISCKLYVVMIKYSILYISSIGSAIIYIMLSYFNQFGYNYSIFDGLINGMILIFLHPIHNKAYKRICCLFHLLCIIILDAPKEYMDEQSKYEEQSHRSSGHSKAKSPSSPSLPRMTTDSQYYYPKVTSLNTAISNVSVRSTTITSLNTGRSDTFPTGPNIKSEGRTHVKQQTTNNNKKEYSQVAQQLTDRNTRSNSLPSRDRFPNRPKLTLSVSPPLYEVPEITDDSTKKSNRSNRSNRSNSNRVDSIINKSPSVKTVNVAIDIREIMKQRARKKFSVTDDNDDDLPTTEISHFPTTETIQGYDGPLATLNDEITELSTSEEHKNDIFSIQSASSPYMKALQNHISISDENLENRMNGQNSSNSNNNNDEREESSTSTSESTEIILDIEHVHDIVTNKSNDGQIEMEIVTSDIVDDGLENVINAHELSPVVDVIMEEVEDRLYVRNSLNVNSLTLNLDSFKSTSGYSTEELQQTRSNTLKFINYESTQL